MKRRRIGSLILVLASATTSFADTAMFDFPPPPIGADTERGTDGFKFRPNVDIEVTSLGYYDHEQNGFGVALHPVAIYDFNSRAELVRANVLNESPLEGLFRYVEIEPLMLEAGVSYVLAGYTAPLANSNVDNPPGMTTASEITYEGYRFTAGGTDVSFPTQTFGTPFFGPNLLFNALEAAAPGDTNGDGLVNLEDLNNVRNQFGATGTPVLGDTAPFDGVVDLEDLNAVRNNFGAGPSASVPEPATGLLAIAFLLLGATKKAARKLARPC
jgi:hypothetical protein